MVAFGVELVDLAAGQRGRIERAIGSETKSLNGQILGFKECERLFALLPGQAEHGGGRACAGEDAAAFVRRQRPYKGRRGGEQLGQSRALAQMTVALNRNPFGGAFFELLHLRLGPKMGALGEGGDRGCHCGCRQRNQKRVRGECGREAMREAGGAKHSAVESTRVCHRFSDNAGCARFTMHSDSAVVSAAGARLQIGGQARVRGGVESTGGVAQSEARRKFIW